MQKDTLVASYMFSCLSIDSDKPIEQIGATFHRKDARLSGFN